MSTPSRRAQEVARDEYLRARLRQEEIEEAEARLHTAQTQLSALRARRDASLGVVRDLLGTDVDYAHVLASREANPDEPPPLSVDAIARVQPAGAPLPEEVVNRFGWGYWREWLKHPHVKGNNL